MISTNLLTPYLFLPPCRGKVRMGVEEEKNSQVSTPSLALPLQGGGDIFANGKSETSAIP